MGDSNSRGRESKRREADREKRDMGKSGSINKLRENNEEELGKDSRKVDGSGKKILILALSGSSSAGEKISRGVVAKREREDGKLQKVVLIDVTMEVETRENKGSRQGVNHDGVWVLFIENIGDKRSE